MLVWFGHRSHVHVRDALDLKRMMVLVLLALVPAMFASMYNTGYQANKIIERIRKIIGAR